MDNFDERPTAIDDAKKIVYGDRNKDYGNPEDNFNTIAYFWSTYLTSKFNIETQIIAEDVAMMMILLKVARESNSHKRDNLIDIIGYAECSNRLYGNA